MKKLILAAMLVLGLAASSWATTFHLNNLGTTSISQIASYAGNLVTVDINTGSYSNGTNSYAADVLFSGAAFTIGTDNFRISIMSTGLGTTNSYTASDVYIKQPSSGFVVDLTGKTPPSFGQFNNGSGNATGYDVVVYEKNGGSGASNPVEFYLKSAPILDAGLANNIVAHFFLEEQTGGAGKWSTIGTYNVGLGGASSVPEPGTIMLLGVGLLGLAVYGKRRMNNKA